MIIIADCGSTKTDWVALNNNKKELFRTTTIGFNPYYVDSKFITSVLAGNEDLVTSKDQVEAVFFYGAGVSNKKNIQIVYNGLGDFFPENTKITVNHDLLGACYAAYKGKPVIVCILGTGSNSCYFDGKNIREETKSLGFILGDEGSGNHLGKKIVRAYFNKKMPEQLAKAFEKKYNNLTVEVLNENVYSNNFANTYLASFSEFAYENKHDPYIQRLIYDSMKTFIEVQISPYKEARECEMCFIGSIAHYYEDIIRAAAAEMHLTVGHIIRKPIDDLVEYHTQYILSDNA